MVVVQMSSALADVMSGKEWSVLDRESGCDEVMYWMLQYQCE